MNIHTVEEKKHKIFLKEERRDPFTKQKIKAGDQIVFCAKCKSVFLVSSWNTIGDKHCNQIETLQRFPDSDKERLIIINKKYNNVPVYLKALKNTKDFLQNFHLLQKLIFWRNSFCNFGKITLYMNEKKTCKVYFLISVLFLPLLLVTFFLGIGWTIFLFFFTICTATARQNFSKQGIPTREIHHIFTNHFVKWFIYLLFVWIFSLWYVIKYLSDTEEDSTPNFFFDINWTLSFFLVSMLLISINWEVYIFVVVFIALLPIVLRI